MRWLRSLLVGTVVKAASAVDYGISLVPTFWNTILWQIASTYPELAAKAYGSNAVVYACMRLLCQSVAEPPLVPSTEDTDGELTPLPKTHPLNILLDRPNELMTQFEMLEMIELHVGLAGGSYWWKQRTNGGGIENLWPLRPDRIVPIYNPDLNAPRGERLLKGWGYYPPGGGKPIPIPRSEMIAFGTPDPAGETGGVVETLGWVQVLATEIAADNEATRFVGSLLANYAQPSMLIKTKMPIRDPEIARKLKAQFMSELGGSHKGEPALLDADTEIEKLSFDLQQLEFPDVRAMSESRISAAAGTPAVLIGLKVGLDKATYSNFESAREFFTETTLSARWRRYSDQFTNDLASEFGPNIVCRFDTSQVKALAGQRQRHAQPIKEGYENSVVMVDEYREKVLNLPPLPNGAGQVVRVKSSEKFVKPEDLMKEPPKPPPMLPPPLQNALPAPDDEDQPEDEDTTEDEQPPARKAVRALGDDVQRRADKSRDRQSDALYPKVRDHLDGQRSRAVSAWNETAKAWPDADDLIPDDGALLEILSDAWGAVMGDAAADAGATLRVDISFDLENEWVQDALDQIGERVRGITETARESLRAIIGRAASEGLSIPDVAKLIQDAFAFSDSRAETIARTETAAAYNLGALRSYEASGLVDEVEVLDGDYDEVCQGLHGQRKSLEWAHANLTQHPRCRRAFAPIVREG